MMLSVRFLAKRAGDAARRREARRRRRRRAP